MVGVSRGITCPSCGSPHSPEWKAYGWWKVLFLLRTDRKWEWRCKDCGLSGRAEDIDLWMIKNPVGTLRIMEEVVL